MPMLRSKELRTICEIGNFNLAVYDHRFTQDLLDSEIPGLRTLTYGSEGEAEGLEDILAMAQDKPTTFEDVPTAADDVSMLAFTAGTTGRPKATMHFHRDILANADTFSRYVLRPEADDVFIGTPPIAFTFGLGGLVIFPLAILLVFLVLAAQYESLTLPIAILLIVPLALLAALAGVWWTAGDNNVFTQIGLIVLAIAMIVTVLNPGLMTRLAEWAGVGRGTDLLLYGLTAAVIVYALSQYLRNQAQRDVIFRLARQMALNEAKRRYDLD